MYITVIFSISRAAFTANFTLLNANTSDYDYEFLKASNIRIL